MLFFLSRRTIPFAKVASLLGAVWNVHPDCLATDAQIGNRPRTQAIVAVVM
jgi:hypothetical protein